MKHTHPISKAHGFQPLSAHGPAGKQAFPPELNSACHHGIAKVGTDLPEAGKPVVHPNPSFRNHIHSLKNSLKKNKGSCMAHGVRAPAMGPDTRTGTGIVMDPTQCLPAAYRGSRGRDRSESNDCTTTACSECLQGRALPASEVSGAQRSPCRAPRDQQAPNTVSGTVHMLTAFGWSERFQNSLQSDQLNSSTITQYGEKGELCCKAGDILETESPSPAPVSAGNT